MGSATLNTLRSIIISTFVSASLFGCKSTVEQAGEHHAKEVKTWQGLANYANSELALSGVTIKANIEQLNSDSSVYSISNIKLSQRVLSTEIDLLSPQFIEKFACGDTCKNINLYDNKKDSLLSSFFEEQEGQFFRFYGRLVRLNKTIQLYRLDSSYDFQRYIKWMLKQNKRFDSLAEFMNYLEGLLNAEKFSKFVESGFLSPDKEFVNQIFLDDDKSNGLSAKVAKDEPLNDLPTPLNGVVDDLPFTEDNKPFEGIDDVMSITTRSFANRPDSVWYEQSMNGLAMTPDELIQQTLILKKEKELPGAYGKVEGWANAKSYEVKVGTTVCSFSDSVFGIVDKIVGDKLSITIRGEARKIVDGVKLMPASGHLFSEQSNFYFVSRNEKKQYLLSDIGVCEIDYLKEE